MRANLYGLLFLALLVSPSLNMTASWANWVLPNWAPDWTYNAGWAPQNPASFGFTKTTFASPSVPGYTTRFYHFYYTYSSNPSIAFACGPESFLRSDYLCERNPKYWNTATAGSLCQPDYFNNNYRSACESSSSTNCCYKSNSGDLYAFYSTVTQYPPGV